MFEELVKQLRYCATHECVGDGKKLVGCTAPYNSEEYEGITTCNDVLQMQAADAIEELSKPRWIPVKEKPPKAYDDVLLLFPHNQAVGFCDRDGCWGVYSGDGFYTEVADHEPKPTHWARKLPEPSKEEETNV